MSSSLRRVPLAALALSLGSIAIASCTVGATRDRIDGGSAILPDGAFFCANADSIACTGSVLHSCLVNGEFLTPTQHDCADDGRICVDGIGCALCVPDATGCRGQDVVLCSHDGQMETVTQTCDITMGDTCFNAQCVNLCQMALDQRSYVGCEFYAADLDNAVVESGDASSQQYAIVVSNAGQYTTDVVVERNLGTFNGTVNAETVQMTSIGPGDLEIFRLPRREVDGSSSFIACSADAMCNVGEHCWCAGGVPPGGTAGDCRCRNAPMATGRNDGTHSALTSNAYRIRSTLPVVAYQFNPLDNVGVFSNDASLLLPTSAIGAEYTVVAWPQTIADSSDPAHDFDSRVHDEDLRSFLTIIGTAPGTHTMVTLGSQVVEVHGVPGFPGPLSMGDVLTFDMGPFDVVNLETHGFNGDFTGTSVVSNNGVTVIAGSEASDAPRFDDLANRQCCADHLEETLFPNSTLGLHFYIGRTPPRSVALNHAFITTDSVGEFNEPEYVRVLAVDSGGDTTVHTTMPFPNDVIVLSPGQDTIITATQDFRMDADRRVAVMQIMASQQATGIANEYPGGDPSLISVPPVDQYRTDYVFLTPLYYGFDFVTIVAPASAEIQLDGAPLDPNACTVSAADGVVRMMSDPPPDWLVYHCQLSFPDVIGLPNIRVEDGIQHDGYHTLQATMPISLLVSGFDRFVSYAYAGGLNLHPLM